MPAAVVDVEGTVLPTLPLSEDPTVPLGPPSFFVDPGMIHELPPFLSNTCRPALAAVVILLNYGRLAPAACAAYYY